MDLLPINARLFSLYGVAPPTGGKGAILQARIVQKLGQHNKCDEIMTCTDLIDILKMHIEAKLNGEAKAHTYFEFVGYQGQLKPSDPRYKGSSWNLLLHWEDGAHTWEPLKILMADGQGPNLCCSIWKAA